MKKQKQEEPKFIEKAEKDMLDSKILELSLKLKEQGFLVLNAGKEKIVLENELFIHQKHPKTEFLTYEALYVILKKQASKILELEKHAEAVQECFSQFEGLIEILQLRGQHE